MRSITAGRIATNDIVVNNAKGLQPTRLWMRRRQAILAAAGALALASSVFGQTTQPVFMDSNGTAANLGSGAVTWNASNTNWATTTAGTTDVAWTAGDVANFNAAFTVTLADSESASGLTFNSGATTITTTGTVAAPAGSLNIGSNTFASGTAFTINQMTNAKQIIAVPIIGSGDMILNSNQTNNGTNTIDLAGNLSAFTGNIYMNNSGTATLAQFQLDTPTGSNAGTYGTIFLDNGVGMTSNNQVGSTPTSDPGTAGDNSTGTLLAATPNIFTISSPIVLNYKNVANASNSTIGAANGPTLSGIKYQKIVTYAGPISGSAGLTIGGTNGTTILSGANTYTGTTVLAYSNSNGFLQTGADNTLSPNSELIIGNGASVGPTDLSGHSQTIAGLATGTTGSPSSTAVGNIFNLTINNSTFAIQNDPANPGYTTNLADNTPTLTVTPKTALATTFKGDIGDTAAQVAPFFSTTAGQEDEPYAAGTASGASFVAAHANINLVVNGAADGSAHSLTLAPVGGLPNGEEYTGTTTINNQATLVLGRISPNTYTGGPGIGNPGAFYTLSGGGAVTVNSGGTISSSASDLTHYYGGASGTITLNSGANMTPGGTGTVGTFVTNSVVMNGGAAMSFDVANGVSFDYVDLVGSLTLDSGTHTVNLGLTPGGTLIPGVYDILFANSGINWDGTHGFTIGTQPAGNDAFNVSIVNGNTVQLQIFAPVLRWDPQQNGADNGGFPTEGSGTWADGSQTFLNLLNDQETSWSNSSTNQVLIGNDVTQNGGTITLGSNITVAGGIDFGPIAAGGNYNIVNSGSNNFKLSIGAAGIAVNNNAAVYNTDGTVAHPSAEIDVPVVLTASQAWEVDPGQTLIVNGALSQDIPANAYTLTKTGAGTLTLNGAGGSIGALNDTAGIVVLGSLDAIGNAPITLNGGGVEFSVNGSPTNSIIVGPNGGGIGATLGFNVLYTPDVSTSNGFEVIGAGNTVFSGSISAGAMQIGTSNPVTAVGNITFNGTVTSATALNFTAGNVTFNQNVSAATLTDSATSGTVAFAGTSNNFSTSISTSGSATLDLFDVTSPILTAGGTATINLTGNNTFTTGITIAGAMVNAMNNGALSGAAVTFPGAPQGGLDVVGMTTLPNMLIGTGSGAGAGGNSFGDTVFIDTTQPFTLTGSTGGTGDLRWYADPTHAGGANPQLILNEASTRPGGGAVYYNISNLDLVLQNSTAMGLSTQVFMPTAATTIDVEVPFSVSGDLRGEVTTSGGSGNLAVIKTGPGILALSGSAGSSTPGTLTINNGEVQVPVNTALGGQAPSSTIPVIGVVVNNTGVFGLDYSGRVSGITLNNGGTLQRDNTFYSENSTTFAVSSTNMAFEVDMTSASATDVVNVTGTGGTIEDAAVEGSVTANTPNTNELFTLANPVMVNAGATLNLKNDNNAGYDTSYILALRGPSVAGAALGITNAYVNVTVQGGATLNAAAGPGQVRFGKTTSQGLAIIAQGTGTALVHMGVAGGNDDVYLTDSTAATGVAYTTSTNTLFVLNGNMRIEAPMDATYLDVTTADAIANPAQAEGSTGLFGVNTTPTAVALPTGLPSTDYGSIGNAFTVMSPNRLAALSGYSYTGVDTTANPVVAKTIAVTPTGGTLTLAANDQANVTGTMLGGPAGTSVSNIALALDNTAPLNGSLTSVTYTYAINPAANSAGGTFANFAGLTVERSNSTGAQVTAQLLGNTKTPSLTLTGGTRVDITTQALVVDPATGPAPTAAIVASLQSAYDSGNWDGPGIGSSSVPLTRGTSIGYAENDLLPTPYDNVSNFFGGASGQPVDNNAVLVRYTWLGDLNLDGVVNSADFTMMGDGQNGWIGGDLNYDHVVNADDWALFMLGNAAQTSQLTSAVPEPAAMSLLAIGAGAMLRRKRRV